MAKAGDTHCLQLDPSLSVGVIERTHAACHSSWLSASVEDENHQTKQDVSQQCDLGELRANLTYSSGCDHISL